MFLSSKMLGGRMCTFLPFNAILTIENVKDALDLWN